MTKAEVIKGMTELIKWMSETNNLTIEDKGIGHGFDGSFWDGYLKDTSKIPTIDASNKDGTLKIGMRPFWSSPEICVRQQTNKGEELLIFSFSDMEKINGEYVHTENFEVHEVRVDSHSDYKKLIDIVYNMIDYVIEHGKME